MQDDITVSFIIPTFNEKDIIVETLTQLHRFAPAVAYEVIIVDNGSLDDTYQLAQHYNDTVLSCPTGSIATVRNHGVKTSKGQILVFLDADVKLTQLWQENIADTIKKITAEPLLITGSRCSPPENNNNLNTHWFSLLVENNSPTYINSGHLIVSRILFDKITGFNDSLRTAEDHDFCVRGTQAGAHIKSNPDLKVIHDGYPTTYTGFIKRERWHGRQDFENLTALLNSKVALVTCLHLTILCSSLALTFHFGVVLGVSSYMLNMSLISIGLTYYKFNKNTLKSLMKTSLIHYFYIIGRTMSLIDRLTFRFSNKFR